MVIGFRDLVDKAMCSEQPEQAADSGRCFLSGWDIKLCCRKELHSQIAISDSLNEILAFQEELEDSTVSRTDRMQCTVAPTMFNQSLADRVKQAVGRRCLSYYCERLQIAPIGGSAYFHSSFQIRNPFSEGEQCHCGVSISLSWATNFETPGIVDSGLDSQDAALLVVHLDRVLIYPMLYTNSFDSLLQLGGDFTFEAVTLAAPEKSQYIPTREPLDCVSDKVAINLSETLFVFEHHIGSVLALSYAPVVTPEVESLFGFNDRIQATREAVEEALPLSFAKGIHQSLCCGDVFNVGEAIISFGIPDTCPVHLPREPFPSIHTDLYGERQPSLQSDMHQPKVAINVIEIDVQTLALFPLQSQFLCLPVSPNGERLARLNTRQNTYQASCDLVFIHNLARDVFLRPCRRFNVAVRTFVFYGKRFSVQLDFSRELLDELPEVFEQYPLDRQEYLQPFYVTDRSQRASKQDAVKTCYSTDDAVLMPLQESLHGLPPHDVFLQTHHDGS